MARTRYWKGHLRLSLVTARVSLTPATTESEKIRFHLLNRETGNRVETRYVDAETHRPVAARNQARGFPKDDSDEEFVILEDKEIESVALESTRTIDIEAFVPAGSVGWIWYDKPHFLRPEDDVGAEAYGVILQAMAQHKVLGIARLVLYGRERAVLLEPAGRGIILWTLRYGETVRTPVVELPELSKADAKSLHALEKAVEKKRHDWRPAMVKDPMQKKIVDLVEASMPKTTRSAHARKKPAEQTGRVIDITNALRKSLRGG